LGSCAITGEEASQGLEELGIREGLIELRNSRSNETPGVQSKKACPHHRLGIGCAIGDLKSPYCLDYIEFYLDDEIEERFGLCLMPIKPYLERAVSGEEGDLIPKSISSINQVREFIEGFPILNNH